MSDVVTVAEAPHLDRANELLTAEAISTIDQLASRFSGVNQFDGHLESLEALSEILEDPHRQTEFSEKLPLTERTQHQLGELGEVLFTASPDTIYDASEPDSTHTDAAVVVRDAAYAVQNVRSPIRSSGYDVVAKIREPIEPGLVDASEVIRILKDDSTSYGEVAQAINSYIDAVARVPSRSEVCVAMGAAFVELREYLSQPGVQKALIKTGRFKHYAGLDPTEQALDLMGDSMFAVRNPDAKDAKNDVLMGNIGVIADKETMGAMMKRNFKSREYWPKKPAKLLHDALWKMPHIYKRFETHLDLVRASNEAVAHQVVLGMSDQIIYTLANLEKIREQTKQQFTGDNEAQWLNGLAIEEFVSFYAKQLLARLPSFTRALGRSRQLGVTTGNLRTDVAAFLDTPLHDALGRQQTANIETADGIDYFSENLAEFLTAKHSKYELSSDELRKGDPDFKFTRALQAGLFRYEGTGRQNLTNGVSKVEAKGLVAFMLSLSERMSEGGSQAVFDELASFAELEKLFQENINGHQLSPDQLTNLRRSVGSMLVWLIENAQALRTAEGVPSGIRNLATELQTYLDGVEAARLGLVVAEPIVEAVESDVVEEEPVVEDEMLDEIDLREVRTKLFGEAFTLDFEVLPPEATLEDLQRDFADNVGEDGYDVDWLRIKGLIDFRDELSGYDGFSITLYRGKPGSLATRFPYYVLLVEAPTKTIAIAENPEYGNATYVVEEEVGTWDEVLALHKRDVRELGGKRFIHADGVPIERHVGKLRDHITMLLSAV